MSKKVLPSHGGSFTPTPIGLHPALCVDVVDKGWRTTQWGDKPKVALVFQVDKEFKEDGMDHPRRFMVSSWYTLSLHKKASLRQAIESWFGIALDDDKLERDGGLDLDKLVGQRAALTVGHIKNKDDETRAVINAVSPLPEGMTRLEHDGEYKRAEDREDYEAPKPSAFGPQHADVFEPPSQASQGDAPPPDDAPPFGDDEISF